MSTMMRAGLISIAMTMTIAGCKPAAEQDATAVAADQQAGAAVDWPARLKVMGDGFPNPGDACRRIGESEATVNYLDDSATLAGCLRAEDAATLGGTVVATVDGVTLVSVPTRAAASGEGDGQGDVKVAGTPYHATAQIRCAGYRSAPAGMCEAGVVRGTDTGSYVEVALPDGRRRTIFFNKDGSFLTFSTAEADGTAGMESGATREGDTTVATLGTERYEIPDAFVMGD